MEPTLPVVVPLPHRIARGIYYTVALLAATALLWPGSHTNTWLAWHAAWLIFVVLVEFRTARLRIVVDDTRLVCCGVFWNRRVLRNRIDHIDLDLPVHGAFLPGGGERLIAVLHDGKRITLSFDRTRRPDGHCKHYAALSRALNVKLGIAYAPEQV